MNRRDFLKTAGGVLGAAAVIGPGLLVPKKSSATQTGAAQATRRLVINFDDGYSSQLTLAVPALISRGLTATIFPVTGRIGVEPGYMAPADIRYLKDAGFPIQNHTRNHSSLIKLTKAKVIAEVSNAAIDLQSMGIMAVPGVVAYPFGDVNPTVIKYLQGTKWVVGGRGIGGLGAPYNFLPDDFDRWNLNAVSVHSDTSTTDYLSAIQNMPENSVLILVWHEICLASPPDEYSFVLDELKKILDLIANLRDSGFLNVINMVQAVEYLYRRQMGLQ